MTKNQILEIFPIGDPLGRYILFDPVTAVMGGVGLIGNVVGGVLGHSAATKAGELQQQAGQAAAQQQLDTAKTANAGIDQAARTGAEQVGSQTGEAAQNVVDAAGKAARGVNDATAQANGLLQPYIDSGADANSTLRTGLAAGGDFNRQFTLDDFQKGDPGYAFRQQQAQQALERSQAARGGALGGGAAKELTQFSQDFASNEFGKAFDRFEQNTNDRFGRLNTVAGRGSADATTAGGNLIHAGEYAGNIGLEGEKLAGDYRVGGAEFDQNMLYNSQVQQGNNSVNAAAKAGDFTTGGAAARAGGIVGGANALSSGLAGGANAVAGALQLRSILKNGGYGGIGGRPAPGGGGSASYGNWDEIPS